MIWTQIKFNETEELKNSHQKTCNYTPVMLCWWRMSKRYIKYLNRRFDKDV